MTFSRQDAASLIECCKPLLTPSISVGLDICQKMRGPHTVLFVNFNGRASSTQRAHKVWWASFPESLTFMMFQLVFHDVSACVS